MRLLHIDSSRPDAAVIAEAARMLRDGGLVAFPTETVYGLGANALSETAVEGIYSAKGRPAYNPLIVHVADKSQALDVAREWNEPAERLAAKFWPGPLTLVLPKRQTIPDGVTAGLGTVGVRVPRHPVAVALLRAAEVPVAAPSANRSTEVSPTTGAHVAKSLAHADGLILDAGPTTVGIESTVIDLSGTAPTLLRPGTITLEELEAVVGPISHPDSAASRGDAARPSPGMMDKHYSPRARLMLADAADIGILVERERGDARRVGALVIAGEVERSATILQMPPDAAGYAAKLYDALHALDDAGCDVIIAERVPDSPPWRGVRDRLSRAAAR